MNYDVVIIGAGSMGMAAGYFLAKAGKSVLLLDAFDPPHSHASHHGETRIIRYAYGEGEEYVPLALRAKVLWEELEQQTGQSLFLKTGVLNIGPKESSFIKMLITSAEKYHLPIEVLSSTQMNTRFPGLGIPEKYIGCFESTSGVLKCEVAIQAYRDLAISHGATILSYHRVTDIQSQSDRLAITANNKIFHADKVVVSAGARSHNLLKMLSLNLPIQPTRKTFAWFNAPESQYGQKVFPAFSFTTDDGIYYGFPNIDGAGLKIGRHDLGVAQDPDEEMAPFDFDSDSHDLRALLTKYMPNVESFKMGKTCMYTMTPDENFIIDHHPDNHNIIIASGFSGHGFKFSSVIGEIIRDIIIEKPLQYDINLFSISRFT